MPGECSHYTHIGYKSVVLRSDGSRQPSDCGFDPIGTSCYLVSYKIPWLPEPGQKQRVQRIQTYGPGDLKYAKDICPHCLKRIKLIPKIKEKIDLGEINLGKFKRYSLPYYLIDYSDGLAHVCSDYGYNRDENVNSFYPTCDEKFTKIIKSDIDNLSYAQNPICPDCLSRVVDAYNTIIKAVNNVQLKLLS